MVLSTYHTTIFFYRDVIADANIFQGAIFHEDALEEIEGNEVHKHDQAGGQNQKGQNIEKPLQAKSDQLKNKPKPAAHRVRLLIYASVDLCFQKIAYITIQKKKKGKLRFFYVRALLDVLQITFALNVLAECMVLDSIMFFKHYVGYLLFIYSLQIYIMDLHQRNGLGQRKASRLKK